LITKSTVLSLNLTISADNDITDVRHFNVMHLQGWLFRWLVGRLTSPFNTKIGYIRDKVLWRFSSTRLRMANDTVTSQPRCLFVQQWPKMGNDRGGSFKLLC